MKRFHGLDLLRGLAALTVVFWHWVHFFFNGTQYGGRSPHSYPLYQILFPFYEKGFKAVDLFFTISGFVFFFMYMDMIRGRRITAPTFFVLRFSRLYPLHLLSLMLVIILQQWYESIHSTSLVYRFNDLKHFILNLLLLNSWGLESGESFNGPSWSISVEAFLYCVFFVFALKTRIGLLGTWLMALVLFVGVDALYHPFARGLGSFFFGGAAFLAYEHITSHARRGAIEVALAWVVPLLWGATFLLMGLVYGAFGPWGSLVHPVWAQKFFSIMSKVWPNMVLFPVTILSMALSENRLKVYFSKVSFLGDISYSTYLLHFPLQIFFVLLFSALGFGQEVFTSAWMLLLFISTLVAVAGISFRYFERPAQNLIRRAASTVLGRGRAS
ncbi:acyltransferase family protein [Ideonella oryzae]|uniref:Acyltransferase n=1 Tax=Ideonella oryzae TaxID=2937441 RepID=A0ABT1BNY1_9BURK|nr:acyltransferase [Ideonella oryzae]MCO5977915.1 acyltransferase [Ideonella oryzae]